MKNLEGKDYLDDLAVDGSIISENILTIQLLRVSIRFIWTNVGYCEHGDEKSNSMKGRKFIQ
jgi:hypothetical protein